MNELFIKYLTQRNLSKNTISSYTFTTTIFIKRYGEKGINKKNLLDYKLYLIENYRPQTVNLRIRGINSYLEFLKLKKLKLTTIKVQSKTYIENVISEADYEFLKAQLKKNDIFWYFVIRFLTATGARVSELIQIKTEHIQIGYIDLYSKGGKLRRIYIPEKLQNEALAWVNQKQITSGYIFLNRFGEKITPRGISSQLKVVANKYGINPKVIYPHSFRHRYAKNFLNKLNDISFLADLMGHESIETTRIYLRKTSSEQQQIINEIVDW